MANTTFLIQHAKIPASVNPAIQRTTDDKKEMLAAAAQLLERISAGEEPATVYVTVDDGATAVATATGYTTISSGSGTITATINGVAIQVTWATSDANTAGLLVAAINASADALVKNIVTAATGTVSGRVYITACQPGVSGNTITLAASGTGHTASGARLTGGVGGTYAAASTSTGFSASTGAGFNTYPCL